jgi:hypothetical protein
MTNWAKWLINHNLRWVLYTIAITFVFPVRTVFYTLEGIGKSIREIRKDFRDIKMEPRD